jgi:hypothetical protein
MAARHPSNSSGKTEYRRLVPSVPALPKWGYAALAGGLMVVGAAVMRKRAA